MWFISLVFFVFILGMAVVLGARFHNQVNARVSKFMGGNEGLPPDFELWLSNHKGEYDSLGKAMGAWADAKFGDKYDHVLKQ